VRVKGAEVPATDVTPAMAANFLASFLEPRSKLHLSAASVANYKSGVRHWWLEEMGWPDPATRPNPFESAVSRAVLLGVRREKFEADRSAKVSRAVTESVGPALLEKILPHLIPAGSLANVPTATASDDQLMIWAAANIAAAGLLRPNEFLGSLQHKGRALMLSQLQFYVIDCRADMDTLIRTSVEKPVRSLFRPRKVVLTLGSTKADQFGDNAPLEIVEPQAVWALWLWCRRRGEAGYPVKYVHEQPLFQVYGEEPLSIRRLCDSIADAIWKTRSRQGRRPHITGRCFRRGGASELVRQGRTLAYIQAIGRWKSAAMPIRYADPSSLAARASAAARGKATPL
jgi:hypothetical protein